MSQFTRQVLALCLFSLSISRAMGETVDTGPACLSDIDPKVANQPYCDNFDFGAFKTLPEAQKTKAACLIFYRVAIEGAKHSCEFKKKADDLRATLVANGVKLKGEQTATQGTSAADNTLAYKTGTALWLAMAKEVERLDVAMEQYKTAIHHLAESAAETAKVEVTECGKHGVPVSLRTMGLAGSAIVEGSDAYVRLRPILKHLEREGNRIGNAFGNPAQIALRNGARLGTAGLPASPSPAGIEPVSPEAPHAVTSAAVQGLGTGELLARAEHGLSTKVGRLIPGVPNSAGLLVGTAGTLLDVGVRLLEHHKLDEIDFTFLIFRGLQVVATASGAVTLGGGVALEAGLTTVESWLRNSLNVQYMAGLKRYLEWAKKYADANKTADSAEVSKRFHEDTYMDNVADPLNRGLPKNSNPAYQAPTNHRCH